MVNTVMLNEEGKNKHNRLKYVVRISFYRENSCRVVLTWLKRVPESLRNLKAAFPNAVCISQ